MPCTHGEASSALRICCILPGWEHSFSSLLFFYLFWLSMFYFLDRWTLYYTSLNLLNISLIAAILDREQQYRNRMMSDYDWRRMKDRSLYSLPGREPESANPSKSHYAPADPHPDVSLRCIRLPPTPLLFLHRLSSYHIHTTSEKKPLLFSTGTGNSPSVSAQSPAPGFLYEP